MYLHKVATLQEVHKLGVTKYYEYDYVNGVEPQKTKSI